MTCTWAGERRQLEADPLSLGHDGPHCDLDPLVGCKPRVGAALFRSSPELRKSLLGGTVQSTFFPGSNLTEPSTGEKK